MIKKIELGATTRHEVFAEPTPLGLIGLSIGCATVTPIAFGFRLTPADLRTAAVLCLLFGAGCQFLSGMMSFVNRNLYGGTRSNAVALNWKPGRPLTVRICATGIDSHEQVVPGKHQFA